VRIAVISVLLFVLTGCGDPPAPPPEKDETTEPWYAQTIGRVNEITQLAEEALKNGKPDEASALIQQGEPFTSQLLSVLHPTLAAMTAAADLDSLYARMLYSNRHYEWAQFLYQKNVARWKYWKPATPETERRLKEAEAQVEDCIVKTSTRKLPAMPKK